MPRITFHGASDDLIEILGPCEDEPCPGLTNRGEYGRLDGKWDDGRPAEFVIVDEASVVQARVQTIYGRNGTWSFACGMAEEDQNPLEHITVSHEARGYTMLLHLDVPDGWRALPNCTGGDSDG